MAAVAVALTRAAVTATQVVQTRTLVDVQWQDGSVTKKLEARTLFPLVHFGGSPPHTPKQLSPSLPVPSLWPSLSRYS